MKKQTKGPHGIIIAGIGGQGVLTIAQLILGAAWRSGCKVMQSEVHGMSQRGGAVNAQVIFDVNEVTSPLILEGSADLILGLEPLESLRYIPFLKKNGIVVASKVPIKTIPDYPDEESVFAALERIPGTVLVDTEAHEEKLGYPHAGSIILVGIASNALPIKADIWKNVIAERFHAKGDKIIQKNFEAFEYGQNLQYGYN